MAENLKEEIEDKVIDCINAGAIGRLVIFKPEKSDKDLIVEKRSDYKKKTISLKIDPWRVLENRLKFWASPFSTKFFPIPYKRK